MTPCSEVDPCEPISPYGQSKLMIEWMLESYRRAYGLDFVAFRYFNACSADGGAKSDHSAMVKALEKLANHPVA